MKRLPFQIRRRTCDYNTPNKSTNIPTTDISTNTQKPTPAKNDKEDKPTE